MEWYTITDIDDFVDKARTIVYTKFGQWQNESDSWTDILDEVNSDAVDDMNSVLSHKESMLIARQLIKKQTNKNTKETRYILNEKIFLNLIQDLNARMVSNILLSLTNKGLIESSYDPECDDFVFWVKDQNK